MAGNGKIKTLARTLSFIMILALCLVAFTVTALASDTDVSSGESGVIKIKVDGKQTPVLFSGKTTVSDAINKLGTTLGELDEVDKELDETISDGDTIQITRKEYVTEIERGVVPHETVYYYSADTTPGKETVVVEGEDGFGEQTFKRLLVDGEVEDQELIGERLGKAPVTEEIAIGFRTKPISDLDFEWEFNENGEPINAKKVLRNQTATAYTSTGNLTSTGKVPQVGHIAVNPAIIPYGSKLFVQSGNGAHIYGYAVAADTGSAMGDGKTVDLFFDSTSECLSYGVKDVDIFVLE